MSSPYIFPLSVSTVEYCVCSPIVVAEESYFTDSMILCQLTNCCTCLRPVAPSPEVAENHTRSHAASHHATSQSAAAHYAQKILTSCSCVLSDGLCSVAVCISLRPTDTNAVRWVWFRHSAKSSLHLLTFGSVSQMQKVSLSNLGTDSTANLKQVCSY